jgi:hypothetical protein
MTLSEFLWGGKERPASSGGCMACVLLLGILNQNALLTHQTPQQVLDGFCHAFENKVSKDLCEAIYDVLDVLGLKTLDPTVPPEKVRLVSSLPRFGAAGLGALTRFRCSSAKSGYSAPRRCSVSSSRRGRPGRTSASRWGWT